jgi:hypothetical protein
MNQGSSALMSQQCHSSNVWPSLTNIDNLKLDFHPSSESILNSFTGWESTDVHCISQEVLWKLTSFGTWSLVQGHSLYCLVLALCLVRAPYFSQSSAKCAALRRGLDYSGKARSINTFVNHQDIVTGFSCFVLNVLIFDINRIQDDFIVTGQILSKG